MGHLDLIRIIIWLCAQNATQVLGLLIYDISYYISIKLPNIY